MGWTPQDFINLAKELVYPFVGGGIILYFLIRHHSGIEAFIFKMKRVGGEVSKDRFKFDASCEDGASPDAVEDYQGQQVEALPQEDEEAQKVEGEDELSLSDILDQIKTDGVDSAKQSFEEYVKQFEEEEPKVMLRVFFLFRLFSVGNYQGVFEDYKSMYDKHTDDDSRARIAESWAMCYSKSKQHEKAQDVLSMALEDVSDEFSKTRLICQLGTSYSDAGDTDRAVELLNERIRVRDDHDEKADLYGVLSTVESNADNKVMAALCLEKKAELMATDANVLFEAAFNLGRAGVKSLSLFQYKNLLDIVPDHEFALNNIGVVASELELEIKSVEYQNKAFGLGNSLACANIGNAFLNAGFVEEARQMALQGLATDSPHENNHTLMARINREMENEEKEWKGFVEKSGAQRNFLNRYTDAYYTQPTESGCPFEGEWEAEDGTTFTVTEEKGKLTAQWKKVEHVAGGLLAGAFGGSQKETLFVLSAPYKNSSARVTVMATEAGQSLLAIQDKSLFNLFSYIDSESGNWIVFNTDLKKPCEFVYKRKAGE